MRTIEDPSMTLFVLAFCASGFLIALGKLNLWYRDQRRRNTPMAEQNAMVLRDELNVW